MPILPTFPPATPPGLLVVVGSAAWNAAIRRQQALYDASEAILVKLGTMSSVPTEAILSALGTFNQKMEKLMSQVEMLVASGAALTLEVAEMRAGFALLNTAIDSEQATVARLVALLTEGPEPSPEIAAVIEQLDADRASIQEARESMAVEKAELDADDLPEDAPAPVDETPTE